MHGQHGAGIKCNRRRQQIRVQGVGVRVDIDKNRRSTQRADRFGSGNKGVRDGDHFITRPNAVGAQGEFQRSGAVADANTVGSATVSGKRILEGAHCRPHDKTGVVDYVLDRGVDFWADTGVLGF